MAEIRVEQVRRRGLGWLWLLVVLALIALAVWYFNNDGVDNVRKQGAARPVSAPAVAALRAGSSVSAPVSAA